MDGIHSNFPPIVVSEDIPEGTIYLVPPVTFVRYENLSTGEVKEYFEFDAKQCAVIGNIGESK